MKLVSWSLVLTLCVVLAPAPANAGQELELTNFDRLAMAGAQVTLRCKVERKVWPQRDVRGKLVIFKLHGGLTGRVLGSARSARDGYADVVVRAPRRAGVYQIRAHVGAAANLGHLVVVERGARVVVTDIDGTISSTSLRAFLGAHPSRTAPIAGAPPVVRALAKNAAIVYITARDDGLMHLTRRWLAHWRFPPGVLMCSDGLGIVRSPVPFKTKAVRRLSYLPVNVVCGFGNVKGDAEAYVANTLPTYIFKTGSRRGFPSATVFFDDWWGVSAAIETGSLPPLDWARGSLPTRSSRTK